MADFVDTNCLKYKVLCLLRSKNCGDGCSQLSMFSSETGEWLEISDKLPAASYNFGNGSKVFFNGSLYWDCIEGHILVCHLNPKYNGPSHQLIEAPRSVFCRSLWKSEDKLHCYCHGVSEECPEWKREDRDRLVNLSDDMMSLNDFGSSLAKKRPPAEFKMISYVPETEKFFIHISEKVYSYQWVERCLERVGLNQSQYVLPYTHSLVSIHTPRTGVDDGAAEKGSIEMKKVKGRRSKRTPRCQDFSTEGED
ncbi:OLC1v1011484C1 [Oldenlandia corymbosa var. corymbosa]|uniref:OLC1v1011484C1 n=1 Tax=Oldenlandia corymbosa var. corymbosa TaxID=529605 RepID=A0AAV1DTS8_OLDCO|nr:OLC1v1011484C1 [Oldenlandia corymbosa var. corymbosa]